MKTKLYLIILTTIILSMASELSTASSYRDNIPKRKKESAAKAIDSCCNLYETLYITKNANWDYSEFEHELKVTDLKEINIKNKVSWMFTEYENELEVTNYNKTEEIFPYWIIIEKEPELEVLDLVVK